VKLAERELRDVVDASEDLSNRRADFPHTAEHHEVPA